MKVGDLVKLAMHKTRKGRPYEDTVGLVTKVELNERGWIATAVFDGALYRFSFSDLRVVSEAG